VKNIHTPALTLAHKLFVCMHMHKQPAVCISINNLPSHPVCLVSPIKMILLPQNCWQKEAVLRPENYQIIYLTLRHFWSGCKLNTTARIPYYRCTGSRVFLSARERWWFVAASKCGGPQVPQFICIIFCLDVRVSSISVHKHINLTMILFHLQIVSRITLLLVGVIFHCFIRPFPVVLYSCFVELF